MPTRWRTTFTVLALGALAIGRGRPADATAPASGAWLDELLFLANQYVVAYERAFSGLVGEEHYEQRVVSSDGDLRQARLLRSDYLLVLTTEAGSWRGYRDVFEVDGRLVRDREARVMALLSQPRHGAARQIERIARESARFNIGSVTRNFNLPLMPLTFLDPLNQHRFYFELDGDEPIDGVPAQIVRYGERLRPTMVQTPTGDVFSHGRFWLEPRTGRVLRSELNVGNGNIRVKASIVVDYTYDAALDLWVPGTMRETYVNPADRDADVIHGLAVYSHYRRFSVSTDYQVK